MSVNIDPNSGDYSRYDSMTTEELENMIRRDAADWNRSTADVDTILYITKVIRERKKPDPNRKTPDESLEVFEEYYLPDDLSELKTDEEINRQRTPGTAMHLSRCMRRLISAAAVVAVLLVTDIVTDAFGFRFLDRLPQWNFDTFHFVGTDESEPPVPSKVNQLEEENLQEVLDVYRITVPLAPKWIPERYEQVKIKVSQSPVQEMFVGIYLSGEDMLKVQIARYLAEDPMNYEVDGALVEEYEAGGVWFYLFEAQDGMLAVWTVENFECCISGAVTQDEMKKIIDSIME